jgi:putative ABC transport system permease protein
MSGYSWTIPVYRADQPLAPGTSPPQEGWRFIAWDYFEAMRIPLRAGRTFGPADHARSTPVGIVNETLARRVFGEPSAAVGQIVVQQRGARAGDDLVEIVGVVGNARHGSLDRAPEPEIFRPLAQTFMFPMAVVVRTAGPPAQIGAAVRQAAYAVDATVPVAELQTLGSLLADSMARPRLLATLLSVFAATGMLLGAIGVHGVVAYRVRQREREFGIRLALGAAPHAIAHTVLREGAWHVLAGLAVGMPIALAVAHLMRSVVFGLTTRDPLTFLALPALVCGATLAACLWPALRAARVDPAETMKAE